MVKKTKIIMLGERQIGMSIVNKNIAELINIPKKRGR